MKVVHLTTAHPPDDIRIYRKECRTLADAGYDVTLISPNPKNLLLESVRLVQLPVPRTRFGRFTGTAWHALRAALRERAAVYHFHDPELMPVAWALAATGAQVIYDVHEDLPRSLLERTWLPGPLRGLVASGAEMLERATGRIAAHVVAVTPAIAARFPTAKSAVVQNYPLLEELPHADTTAVAKRANQILYSGTVTVGRGLHQMADAVRALPDDLGAVLEIVGVVDPEFRAQFAEEPSIRTFGWCSRAELHSHINSAKVGLVLFHPHPNHVNAQPNKLFEYMMAGVPVVASDFPLWRQIVGDENCGILVDPLDVDAIARAIEYLLRNPTVAEEMGSRGRAAVLRRYNWPHEAAKLLELYGKLATASEHLPGHASRFRRGL